MFLKRFRVRGKAEGVPSDRAGGRRPLAAREPIKLLILPRQGAIPSRLTAFERSFFCLLFAFDFRREHDKFVGQFSELFLRFSVPDLVSMLTTRGGLTSEIDGAVGHSRPWVRITLV